ncbi:MAG: hypothetical protein NC319_05890 [Butyricicoccus sp.]|nr:hypothetical protein [Butyricicoccus sp.]
MERAAIEISGDREQLAGDTGRIPTLSNLDKMYLMVDAIFNEMFTAFDFDALQADIEECEALDSAQDYGARYQELCKLLNSQNFRWKYYQKRSETNKQ